MYVCITYWGELSGGNVLPKTGGGIVQGGIVLHPWVAGFGGLNGWVHGWVDDPQNIKPSMEVYNCYISFWVNIGVLDLP